MEICGVVDVHKEMMLDEDGCVEGGVGIEVWVDVSVSGDVGDCGVSISGGGRFGGVD